MRATSFPFLRACSPALLLLSAFTLVGCGISQPVVSRQIVASSWQEIAAPAGLRILSFAVAPDDPATLYACTLDRTGNGLVLLWRTRDAGSHWSRLPLPPTAGSDCQISVDPAQSQFVIIDVTNHSTELRPCDGETFYLSTDSGDVWQPVPHSARGPLNPTYSLCNIQVIAARLYLWSSYEMQGQPQVSMLERSDNEGVNWTRIDSPLGNASLFVPPQIASDGKTVTVSVLPMQQTGSARFATLWTSHDAGQSWQRMDQVPGDTFLLAPSTQGESSSVQTPLYNLSAEQPPEFLYLLHVYQSNNERLWSALPSVPAPGTSAQRQGLLQALAVTDDGRLLAFGVSPQTGIPSQASAVPGSKVPAFWLWIWNPASARWQVLSLPLKFAAEESCDLCWKAALATGVDHVTYLTVAHMAEINDPNSGYQIFRVRIPDA